MCPSWRPPRRKWPSWKNQLGEKSAQLGTAKKERDRLVAVETELQAKAQKLTSDLANLTAAHASDMQKLLDARTQTEEELQKERDAAVKRAEEVTERYQREIRPAQAQAELALASLQRVDATLAGRLLHCADLLPSDLIFLPSDLIFFPSDCLCQVRGPILRLLLPKLWLRVDKLVVWKMQMLLQPRAQRI